MSCLCMVHTGVPLIASPSPLPSPRPAFWDSKILVGICSYIDIATKRYETTRRVPQEFTFDSCSITASYITRGVGTPQLVKMTGWRVLLLVAPSLLLGPIWVAFLFHVGVSQDQLERVVELVPTRGILLVCSL